MFQRFFAPAYSGDKNLPAATKYLEWRLARTPGVTSFEDNQAFWTVVEARRVNEPKMQEYVMQALWWTKSGATIRDGTSFVPPSLPLSRLALGIIKQRPDCFIHRSAEICHLLDNAQPSLFDHAITTVREIANLRWPESLGAVLESAYQDPDKRKHVLRFLGSKSWDAQFLSSNFVDQIKVATEHELTKGKQGGPNLRALAFLGAIPDELVAPLVDLVRRKDPIRDTALMALVMQGRDITKFLEKLVQVEEYVSPDLAVAIVASALKSDSMRGYVTKRLHECGDSTMNLLKAIGNSSAEVSKMFCAEVTLLAFGGDELSKGITQLARELLKNENFASAVDLDADAADQFFSFSTSPTLRTRIVNLHIDSTDQPPHPQAA